MKIWTVTAVAALGLAAAATLSPAGAATAQRPSRPSHIGRLVPAHPGELLPHTNATVGTLNWAGYAVTPPAGQAVTAVRTTFVVPTVTDVVPGFAATWAGIGGYSSSDLIQAGVGEQFAPGLGPSYYAWYETLPDPETPLTGCSGTDRSCTVTPGDTVTVAITQGANAGTWHIAMSDGTKWSWQKDLAYTSSRSSAEWILEAPTVAVQTVLPLMSPTAFSSTNSYALSGGGARMIASGSPVTLQMLGLGIIAEGQPSALGSSGSSFNACAYSASCAAPTAAKRATATR